MTQITIDGKNLHEIKMRLKGEHSGSICYLSYPEHRIKAKVEKNSIILLVPPLLAIALYHLIFQNKKEVQIKVKNKERGLLQIVDLKYPDELYDDGLVEITLESIKLT